MKTKVKIFIYCFFFLLSSSILLLHSFPFLGGPPLAWDEIAKSLWIFIGISTLFSVIVMDDIFDIIDVLKKYKRKGKKENIS